MTDTRPSYDPHATPGGVVAEIERLEAQAALTWDEEARILRTLGVPEARAVLEVGCGSGAFLARMRRLAPDADLIGVEPDSELASAARTCVPTAEIVAGTIEQLPIADDSVDVVVARLVLQHVVDPTAALAGLRRVLRPGGVAVAIEVDGGLWGLSEPSFPEVADVYAKVWLSQWRRGGDRMIGRRLPTLFRVAGFVDVRLQLYGYSSFEHGLDGFAAHLDPITLEPFVADGTIDGDEYALAADAYRRFREDPDAFVLLAGLVASGRCP